MISIGAKVRITRINKNDCGPVPPSSEYNSNGDWIPPDERRTYVGQVGTVVRREVGTGSMPCGESPEDPFYIVKTPIGQDEFWTEELALVKP